ncbi:uncharacterized protein [Tenebrio molitor]
MLKMQRWRDITIKMGILQSTTTQQLESLQAAHLLHYRLLQTIPGATTPASANAMCPSYNFATIVLVLTITVIIFSDKGTTMSLPCRRCFTSDECNSPPPDFCPYGENKNYCGRRVCSKGPGEKCSNDQYAILGTCGEGMWCSNKDNRCHGCFIATMTCYE